ncbi:MAG: hypothetical protein DI526_14320 [Caulobacter segnis]|uniref:Uncharacterized protein n=1 Tax=Caulobacter segnis TaxID=88688 RepID=A0A2W5WYH4_9CAUL|nr:MAG: hypothetical protein DI526_14320 [Caulobacter segnis]
MFQGRLPRGWRGCGVSPAPTSAPARPPPEAAKVAGRAPSPVLRGGKRIRRFLRGWMKSRERSLNSLSLREREGPMRSMGG